MALPSTLYRFDVHLSHVDRRVERQITIQAARHPSETLERLWLRVLAFCWQWEEGIAFGPGLCEPEAPELEVRGADGTSRTLIVRVGRPELSRIEKDCARGGGARVAVLFDAPRRLHSVIEEARAARPERVAEAQLWAAPAEVVTALARHDERRQKVACTIADDHLYLELGGETLDGPLTRGSV